MKRIAALVMVIGLIAAFTGISYAAENEKAGAAPVPPMGKMPQQQVPPRPMLGMISGTVSNIDTSDPQNAVLEIKSDTDEKVHKVVVQPWTNVTKVTDITELKAGDPVRVMSRKADDKEVAMGVIFGKMRKMPMPAPMAEGQAAVKKPALPPAQKK